MGVAYRGQTITTSTSGSSQPRAATGGLLSPQLWTNPRGAIPLRANRPKNASKSPPITFDFHHAKDPGNELPDELVRLYPDLDNDSRNFLKYGPRSPAEKLAYAQRVNPLAHLDALQAPQEVQQRFQDTGELEETETFFIGPDGRVYLRNEDSDEQLGAKVRRGYEHAIGGFDEPTVSESLGDISEATRSKRADVELYNPPTLPEQEERERMLAPYNVNPAAWQLGDRADDETQRAFQEAGYLWDAVFPWAYVGPDGVVYYKNELTRKDPLTAFNNARDWWETQQYLETLPDPTAAELLWRAMAAGGMLPGGRQVNFKNSSGKFVRPGSLEAGLEIRARLADIPRLAALYGWKQAPEPEALPRQRTSATANVARVKRSKLTRYGIPRNARADWVRYRKWWDNELYGAILSPVNHERIRGGRSPKVDEQWIEYFPEDAGLLGETIIMHHVGNGPLVVPLPFSRHMDAHRKGTRWADGEPGGGWPVYPRK